MSKRFVPVVAALTLVLGMSGCGQQKADKGDLIDKLVDDDKLPQKQAECVADAIFDDKFEGDDDTLNDIASAEEESDLPPAVVKVLEEVKAACEDKA